MAALVYGALAGRAPLGGGAAKAWKRIACVIVIGLALQVVVGYVTDAVLSLLPEAAADYSELVEETGMGDTSYLAVLTRCSALRFARNCWCAVSF